MAFLMVFNGFQWFSMVFKRFQGCSLGFPDCFLGGVPRARARLRAAAGQPRVLGGRLRWAAALVAQRPGAWPCGAPLLPRA